MIYYASENHLNLSDSWLEYWMLRYSQNRGSGGGGGGSLPDPAASRQNTRFLTGEPAMQKQLIFLMLFADDILHLWESPQFVQFLIGALVVEVFTEPWFATRRLTKHPILRSRCHSISFFCWGKPRPRAGETNSHPMTQGTQIWLARNGSRKSFEHDSLRTHTPMTQGNQTYEMTRLLPTKDVAISHSFCLVMVLYVYLDMFTFQPFFSRQFTTPRFTHSINFPSILSTGYEPGTAPYPPHQYPQIIYR